MITLTKTQRAGIILLNEKLQLAQFQLNQTMDAAKLFLRDIVTEANEDPDRNWIFDDKTMTLSLQEDNK